MFDLVLATRDVYFTISKRPFIFLNSLLGLKGYLDELTVDVNLYLFLFVSCHHSIRLLSPLRTGLSVSFASLDYGMDE